MQDFQNLKIWQKSHELARRIYVATAAFPATEMYSLTSQMRRAVTSIPANIAEGCGRGSDADFARFLQIAIGSASEAQYLILLARDLSYLGHDAHSALDREISEVKRMLATLMKRLKTSRAAARRPSADS